MQLLGILAFLFFFWCCLLSILLLSVKLFSMHLARVIHQTLFFWSIVKKLLTVLFLENLLEYMLTHSHTK